ncbi:MAG TPA: transketolase C-terminal domain-containing protein, partial [Acidimicrobiales bacterium]|nr:transketolase C-terminal domain-containing protein [Acidimicrobiales bacterium]
MAEQPVSRGAEALANSTNAQDLSEVFRGSAGGEHVLKDARSTRGIEERSVPAFVAGQELADLADADRRIVVLTADLANANRTADFAKRHPDRFFNVGVAEQNMVSVAAGMASTGLVPFVATFASYLALLACEQIRTDCAYTGMPVRLLGHHSGMSLGFYGTSHHSLEDISLMRTIADMTVVCAADANELRAILRLSLDWPGAMYIRLGRGRDPEVYATPPAALRIGRAIRLRDGSDLTMISTGSQVRACLDAAELLAADGISVRVVDMHTIRPLDTDEIMAAATETAAVLTVEE